MADLPANKARRNAVNGRLTRQEGTPRACRTGAWRTFGLFGGAHFHSRPNCVKATDRALPLVPADRNDMTAQPAISFARFSTPGKGTGVVLVPSGGDLGDAAKACDPA